MCLKRCSGAVDIDNKPRTAKRHAITLKYTSTIIPSPYSKDYLRLSIHSNVHCAYYDGSAVPAKFQTYLRQQLDHILMFSLLCSPKVVDAAALTWDLGVVMAF